jgi:hypothetical protein
MGCPHLKKGVNYFKLSTNLIVVEHGSAVHGCSSVPRAELVETVKDWTIVANVEVIQTLSETLKKQ